MNVIVDIECDSLNPSTIWCVVCKEIETNDVHVFTDMFKFAEYANSSSRTWIGHNILSFDVPVLNRLTLCSISPSSCVDTLLLSRLLKVQIPGGHSLEAWGQRLKFPKTEFNDWSRLSQEMIDYCIQDVELTHKVYDLLKGRLGKDNWKQPIELEHKVALICNEMSANGFAFNLAKANAMKEELLAQIAELDTQIKKDFPTRVLPVGEVVVPEVTSKGTIHKGRLRWYPGNIDTDFNPDCPYQKIEYEEFNPRSHKQVIDRICDYWSPTDKTTAHVEALKTRTKNKDKLEYFSKYGWKINEENLGTLREDSPQAARLLVKRLLLDTRVSSLNEWLAVCSPNDCLIHGNFSPLGAWTQRATHSKPNMANIATAKSLKYNTDELRNLAIHYGHEMRTLWTVRDPDNVLVGTDAEGIQLRILSHYMRDQDFIDALVSGDKKQGTDVHTLNMNKLGPVCRDRDNAKTFIYAWLLGAGTAKVASILNCNNKQAKAAVDSFIDGYPGLKRLKERDIPKDAARGYIQGLDGRYVVADEERKVLAAYLQNGEAIIMKLAMVLWYERLKKENIPFLLVNWVHDEWVVECNKQYAKYIGEVQCWAIEETAKILNLNCPMAGTTQIGTTWADIH